MKRLSLFVALGTLSAWAIDIPHVGYALDAQGIVRPIDGVAGNFRVGDPIGADAAVAFSWNGVFGIRKTETSVEWWDSTATKLATLDAPPGAVVIGFDRSNSQTAWIYSETTHTLSEVTANEWGMVEVPVSLAAAEEVLALAGGRNSVDIAVRRGEEVYLATFDRTSGTRAAEVPLGVSGSSKILLLQDGSILGTSGSTIWLRRVDGSQWRAESAVEVQGFAWMGREWIQLTGAGRQFALRIRAGSDPALFAIPQQAVTQ